MINIPPIKPSTEIKAEILPDVSKIWKIGQVLNARAETGGDALSKIVIRIGQQLIEARTPIPIKTGEELQLQVKALGDPPLLSIVTTADTKSIAIQQLRTFIAQQNDISQFIQSSHKLVNDKSIPQEIRQLVNTFIAKLPTPENTFNVDQLKRLIQNSGVFLEAKIPQQQPATTTQDFKAQLLKISQEITKAIEVNITKAQSNPQEIQKIVKQFVNGDIDAKQLGQLIHQTLKKEHVAQVTQYLSNIVAGKPLPQPAILKTDFFIQLENIFKHIKNLPNAKQLNETLLTSLKNLPVLEELKINIDNALAKITTQQLVPLTREADNFLLLLFGILIKDKDAFHLIDFRIEEEKNHNKNEESNWHVTINFEFKELGKIQAKIHLLGSKIATAFNAERSSTVDKIKQNIHLLENALQKLGLDVTSIDISQISQIDQQHHFPENIHILDENA